jgi:hypothetical protein
MIGGGFLGQGHKSSKENRERLRDAMGKNPRKPFDKSGVSNSAGSELLKNEKELTESERQNLVQEVLSRNAQEVRKKMVLWLVGAISLIAALIYLIYLKQ